MKRYQSSSKLQQSIDSEVRGLWGQRRKTANTSVKKSARVLKKSLQIAFIDKILGYERQQQ